MSGKYVIIRAMTIKVIYPGTFDPLTNGHADLIRRAATMFAEVIVAVAANPAKAPLFTLQERVDMIKSVAGDWPHVSIIGFDNLLIECAQQCGAKAILRGLRAASDFEYEFQLAGMNRRLNAKIETVFLTPAEEYTFLSASLVKEVAALKGDVSQFVDARVAQALTKKLATP